MNINNKLAKTILKRDKEFQKLNFQGNFGNFYKWQDKRTLKIGKLRIRKGFCNTGLWLVKDKQGKNTLNLWILRLQF